MTKGDEPIFSINYLQDIASCVPGLTKREYLVFSIAAARHPMMFGWTTEELKKKHITEVAAGCIEWADALIAELSKGEAK